MSFRHITSDIGRSLVICTASLLQFCRPPLVFLLHAYSVIHDTYIAFNAGQSQMKNVENTMYCMCKTLHAIAIELNHINFISIPFVRKMFLSVSIIDTSVNPRTVTSIIGGQSLSILTIFCLQFIIYPLILLLKKIL